MEKVFGINSPLRKAVTAISDTVILSLLWLIGSLPVVTVGISTTAAYYAAMHINTGGYGIWHDYWKSFRQNWKQAAVLELICLVPVLSLLGGCYLMLALEEQMPVAISFVYGILLYACIAAMGYIFPQLAYFEHPTKVILKNACLIPLANAGWTLLSVIIHLIPLLLLMLPVQWLAAALPLLVAIFPGMLFRINSLIFRRVFSKYVIDKQRDNSCISNNEDTKANI